MANYRVSAHALPKANSWHLGRVCWPVVDGWLSHSAGPSVTDPFDCPNCDSLLETHCYILPTYLAPLTQWQPRQVVIKDRIRALSVDALFSTLLEDIGAGCTTRSHRPWLASILSTHQDSSEGLPSKRLPKIWICHINKSGLCPTRGMRPPCAWISWCPRDGRLLHAWRRTYVALLLRGYDRVVGRGVAGIDSWPPPSPYGHHSRAIQRWTVIREGNGRRPSPYTPQGGLRLRPTLKSSTTRGPPSCDYRHRWRSPPWYSRTQGLNFNAFDCWSFHLPFFLEIPRWWRLGRGCGAKDWQ